MNTEEGERLPAILELTFICLQFFIIFKGLLPPTHRLQEKGFEIFFGEASNTGKIRLPKIGTGKKAEMKIH